MKRTHPFNVLKFCPRCGSEKFRAEPGPSLKCGQCGFHFYINAAAAVAALIVDANGKLMLVTRGVEPDYGKLDLPGGFVDPEESVEEALIRELKEELGISIQQFEYLGSAPNEYIFSEFSVFTVDLAFKVIPKSVEQLAPKDDILEFHFYSEEEINYDDIPAPSIKQFVQQFFQNERNQTQA
ncbi:MAG TPA: NUDIX domain-containing protein [Draconibacterium sp.]|nr:NUDIX domain-containing protein [Draconibacterium sp.]